MPQHYTSYKDLAATVVEKAKSISGLLDRDGQSRNTLGAFLKSRVLDSAQVKYLPLQAKAHDQTVLVNASTAEILGIIDIDPWR